MNLNEGKKLSIYMTMFYVGLLIIAGSIILSIFDKQISLTIWPIGVFFFLLSVIGLRSDLDY